MIKATKYISTVSLGIALYVVLSSFIKIPIIGHIGLDLGYIALAVYAYHFGCIPAMIVGSFGCSIVSLLFYGWFPFGWFVANLFVGAMCGGVYHKYGQDKLIKNYIVTVAAVFVGIALIKTMIECAMFGIPVAVKLPKNLVAASIDAVTMCAGLSIAPKIKVAPAMRESS